jgi:acyl-CoA thioesterase I
MRPLLTFLITLTALGCGGKQVPTAPDQLIPIIVAFGDSLTSGPELNLGQTWPALVQRRLDDEGFNYRVINSGVSGDTSSEAVERIDTALVPDTRIMVLALGINDGVRGVPTATLEKNLATIIERAKAKDIAVLLCGMEAPPLRGLTYSIEFHRVFTRIADRYQLPLVPFFLLGVVGHSDLTLPDHVHPNAAGHRVIADAIWQYLKPMLTR